MSDADLPDASAFLRTPKAALENGDLGPAYECARTAAELAAKTILRRAQVAAVARVHNVAPLLVEAGLWPGGETGRRLSKFLADSTRGVYGIGEPLTRNEVERGIRLAQQLIDAT